MKCPFCGSEMQHGQITGSKVLRLSPPADYCRSCKKMIFEADII